MDTTLPALVEVAQRELTLRIVASATPLAAIRWMVAHPAACRAARQRFEAEAARDPERALAQLTNAYRRARRENEPEV